jgi:hypothetical protein
VKDANQPLDDNLIKKFIESLVSIDGLSDKLQENKDKIEEYLEDLLKKSSLSMYPKEWEVFVAVIKKMVENKIELPKALVEYLSVYFQDLSDKFDISVLTNTAFCCGIAFYQILQSWELEDEENDEIEEYDIEDLIDSEDNGLQAS